MNFACHAATGSLKTWVLHLANTVPLPPGKVYGCCFLKTWPTLLQGMISRLPPHCHTRNEISKKYLENNFKVRTSYIIYCQISIYLHICCLNGWMYKLVSQVPMPLWVTMSSQEKREWFCLFSRISLLHLEQSMGERKMFFHCARFGLLCTMWFSPLSKGHKDFPINSVIFWNQLAPERLNLISFGRTFPLSWFCIETLDKLLRVDLIDISLSWRTFVPLVKPLIG